jgi:hypothetical protein
MSSFSLLPSQVPHFKRVLDICQRYGCYADNSVMGCGKTYVAAAAAKEMVMDMVVVCPLTVQSNWKRVCKQAGVKLIETITPQSLASQRGRQPKHGYLDRDDSHPRPHFTPTDKLQQLIQRGCLFVFDEIQFARNINTYFLAVKAIVRAVGLFTSRLTSSRCAFISTTPFVRPEKAAHFLMLLNILKDDWICNRNKINPNAIQDLYDFAASHQLRGIEKPQEVEDFYTFFLNSIQPRLFSSMPLILDYGCDIRNGFYKIENAKERSHLLKAIQGLNKIRKCLDPKTMRLSFSTIKCLTLSLQEIETAKIPLWERLIQKELDSESKRKVVVCLSFNRTITALKDFFKDYNPLVLTGQVKTERARQSIIDKFQEASTDHRLLICNIRVGGVGISLHDLDGQFPRTMLISPNYDVVDIFQATGRVRRVGGASESRIRLVYGNLPLSECSILKAIARCMSTIKQMLATDVCQALQLPTDFEDYIEGPAEFEAF